MDLSIIIVSYKGWEKLSKCLKSLDAFVNKSFSMEVIVVDNYSGDGIINDIEKEFSKFNFIKNKINGGYAYGCNRAAESAKGDFFMILNPDTIVTEKEIEKLLENAKSHPEYFIVSCRQVRENGTLCRAGGKFPELSFGNLVPFKADSTVSFPDWVSGSLMLMRKDTFKKLNGFDESFWMYYEDVDICRRARNAGGEIALFNDIVIEHNHGGSSRINPKTTSITKCEVQASRHFYIHKHFRGHKRFLLQLLTISDNLVTGIFAGIIGLIFFFVPKLFIRFFVLQRLAGYYSGSLLRRSWISPRSVKFKKGDQP
ncbi:MAG: glycosyltransferase family 2 protein [Bacteroidia bacterium]|nr:glycosyltransferase family 2 protein [Bacteroidia bacterium]